MQYPGSNRQLICILSPSPTVKTADRPNMGLCVCEPPCMGAEGQSFCFHTTSLQGDGGVAGGSVHRSNPGKRTCIACAWAPLWAAGGALTFVHFSFHFVLRHSFVSDVARGRNLTPDGSSHLVLHAILDVWHVWHKTFHPIFVHHHHHPPHSPLSRFGSCPLPNLSVCVCKP